MQREWAEKKRKKNGTNLKEIKIKIKISQKNINAIN